MNVSDDPVACCVNLVHRVGEEVTGGSLDEIFGELSAIGFDRVPRSVSAHHNIRRHPEWVKGQNVCPESRIFTD